MALEGEDVLAGPEDALDPLADRREVWPLAGLVFSAGTHDRGLQVAGRFRELFAGVALVGDHGLSASPLCAGEQLQRDLALVELGGRQRDRSRSAIRGAQGVQPEPPEEPAVAGAIPIVSGIGELRALDRLAATSALHRR